MARVKVAKPEGPGELAVERVAIEAIYRDPNNAREHDERNLATIAASLRKYGQRKPVVARRRDGLILAGNGTHQAAESLGWGSLWVAWSDLDGSDAAGFSLVDNRSSDLSRFNYEALAVTFRGMQDSGDLDQLFGWEPQEYEPIIAGYRPADANPPAGPDPNDGGADGDKGDGLALIRDVVRDEPKFPAKQGVVYRLGRHVLACVDVINGWPAYVPHLAEGSMLCPYPSPLLPLARARGPMVLVQPDLYLAAMTCDLYLAANPGEEVVPCRP